MQLAKQSICAWPFKRSIKTHGPAVIPFLLVPPSKISKWEQSLNSDVTPFQGSPQRWAFVPCRHQGPAPAELQLRSISRHQRPPKACSNAAILQTLHKKGAISWELRLLSARL